MIKNLASHLDANGHKLELSQMIGEVSRAWRHEMNQRLKPFGLNVSMRQVLMQLHKNPEGLMQRDLARKLGIEGPTLVRLLDQLEKKQWIRRVTASDDKRCKYSMLTPKATEQIQIIEKLSHELRIKMMKGLSREKIEAGLHAMTQIRDNLQI
jgi:MarR family transcriptional regulator, transcriptional regulator for hemolysin